MLYIVKFEAFNSSSDTSTKRQLKNCYMQVVCKDMTHNTAQHNGDTILFNEYIQFDLSGWWSKYQFTIATYEKKKSLLLSKKDSLLGGISLQVGELLEAVGFDISGTHHDSNNSRSDYTQQPYQKPTALYVKPGYNPSQIFWYVNYTYISYLNNTPYYYTLY